MTTDGSQTQFGDDGDDGLIRGPFCDHCHRKGHYSRFCGPCRREAGLILETVTFPDPRSLKAALGLYNGSAWYARDLAELGHKTGWWVHPNQERHVCPRLLLDRRHKGTWCYPTRYPDVSHEVLMINAAGDFAVLDQPYEGWTDDWPPAPYGHGTRMHLITGDTIRAEQAAEQRQQLAAAKPAEFRRTVLNWGPADPPLAFVGDEDFTEILVPPEDRIYRRGGWESQDGRIRHYYERPSSTGDWRVLDATIIGTDPRD